MFRVKQSQIDEMGGMVGRIAGGRRGLIFKQDLGSSSMKRNRGTSRGTLPLFLDVSES